MKEEETQSLIYSDIQRHKRLGCKKWDGLSGSHQRMQNFFNMRHKDKTVK